MNTMKSSFGFLLVGILMMLVPSCNTNDLAKAEITILEEYSATQGQVLQTRPIEGVEAHFSVPRNGTEHLEAIEFTNSEGKVFFEYDYEVLLHLDIVGYTMVSGRNVVAFVPGETTKQTVVVSQ